MIDYFDKLEFKYDEEAEFLAKRPLLTEFDQRLINHASIIKDLNSIITLHDAQAVMMHAFFGQNKRTVFGECGRKFGKTEVMEYFLSRTAMPLPNSAVYFIAPFGNQAGEILWHSGRLKNFFPDWFVEKYEIKFRSYDYRIIFGFNGSFIKLAGSDNYEAYRGVNPHGLGYDEFKDHHVKFHAGMSPNLATFQAPHFIIGTPPETEDNQFCVMADYAKTAMDEAWFNFPSWVNPHIDRAWLAKEKAKLIRIGKADEWFREYAAKRIKSSVKHIFSKFRPKSMMVPHKFLIGLIDRTRRDWAFYCTADPGSSKCFAVLFTAINKYNKMVFHLDEIYEKVPVRMTTRNIGGQLIKKCKDIHPWFNDWTFTYDEAAKWFQNEFIDNFGEQYPDVYFSPTMKGKWKNEEDGISLINEQMVTGNFLMSENCQNLKFELNECVTDKNGKIPDKNNHLLDCSRYTNNAADYSIPETARPQEIDVDKLKRAYTMEADLEEEQEQLNDNFDEVMGGWY